MVLIAHTPKGGRGTRGSGDWDASADSNLSLFPGDGDGVVRVEGKGRHAPVGFTYSLDGGSDGGGMVLRALDAEPPGVKPSSPDHLAAVVQHVLADKPDGLSVTGISDQLREHGVRLANGTRKVRVEEALALIPGVRSRKVGKADHFYLNGNNGSS